MGATIRLDLLCGGCGFTITHHANGVNVVTAEQFTERVFHGWNVDPRGRTLCPDCVAEAGKLARRAERSARDKARHRGELPPVVDTIRVRRADPNTGTPKSRL
ncbi:hypothetical protein [Nocardia asteroides]|uniref:hypothetical protein n=1 Tax=Nocardia asteroides TaxID=1824 RepID=UPI0033CAD450